MSLFKINNFLQNDDVRVTGGLGPFRIIEYKRDLSVDYHSAQKEYYAAQMNIKKKQLICQVGKSNIIIQAGDMQWILGDVNISTGVKGIGDFMSKSFRGKVTNESAIKPEYSGEGIVVLEPTYKHIILLDVKEWGSIVIEDGLFLACESQLKHRLVTRSNLSSTLAGGEGFFNLAIEGDGVLAIESSVPKEELVEIELNDDVLKIDGNMAVAWSNSLNFTVERSTKSLIGSAASGEGLVNVYRGTGKILMAPVN